MDSLLQYLYERPAEFAKTTDFRSFYEDVVSVEASRVEGVWRAVVAASEGDAARAAAEAEAIVRAMPDADDEHGALALRTFAEAVLERLSNPSGVGGNLTSTRAPPARSCAPSSSCACGHRSSPLPTPRPTAPW